MNKKIFLMLSFLASLLILACSSIPDKAKPVSNFDAVKYMGQWYEIARIDFKFEKDLDNTSAFYTLNDDGSIKVLNKGYNYVKNKWQESEGKARFRGDKKIGALEVSFFGPFYSGYNVIALEQDYSAALIAGKNLDYLWILSRDKSIDESVKKKFLEVAKSIGYNTDRLLWVNHDK